MEILKYRPEYKESFIRLNTAWIEKYFTMEQDDYDEFESIDAQLEKGAMIFFAVENENILAACMVTPINSVEWEMCKMAAADAAQGRGAGSAVFQACMDYAIENGAQRIIIISNRILKPALHIYEKFGFKEIPVDETHNYERADIQFEYLVGGSCRTVVKQEDAKKRAFKGVQLDSLAVGEKSMVTRMNYVPGNFADTHTHFNEQCGYVVSGKYELIINGTAYELTAGDSYAIPGNVPHSFKVFEGGEVIDVFTPPRRDYL